MKDPFKFILGVTCVLLAVLVVVLARQNLILKRAASAPAPGLPTDALRPGDVLGSIVLIDDAGDEKLLTFPGGDSGTVLLVFSTQCPACREVLPFWAELGAGVGESSPRIIALGLDAGAKDVVAPYPIYLVEPTRSPGLNGVPYIPATLVLDGRGVVQQAWFGSPDISGRKELTDYFDGS